MSVRIYTDGGCWNQDGVGGWAAFLFVDNDLVEGVYGGMPDTTNNQMELSALIGGMELLPTYKALRCKNCGVVNKPCTEGQTSIAETCPILGAIQRPVYSEAVIVSDSQYCVNGASAWVHGWQKNGWKTGDKKPVKNRLLWEEIIRLTKLTGVTFEWVKGHNGDAGNELADTWATKAKQKTLEIGTSWRNTVPIGE